MKISSNIAAAAAVMALSASADGVDGLKARFEQAEKGGQIRCVFFGGSLTWGANASEPNETSWRGRTMEYLIRKYPKSQWAFHDAAIGGTGSELGVFRLERDVLGFKPDIVFLDFTLNDGLQYKSDDGGKSNVANGSFETIIRCCLEKGITIVPVFLTSKCHVTMENVNDLNRRLEHLQLIDYYNLDYIDILGGMNRDYKAGKLDITGFWPEELFDETHPHDIGYQAYADYGFREFDRILAAPARTSVLKDEWFFNNRFEHRVRLDAADMKLPEGWFVSLPYWQSVTFDWMSSRWMDKVAVCSNAKYNGYGRWEKLERIPAGYKVRFRGNYLAIFHEAVNVTPKKISYVLDGKKRSFGIWSRPTTSVQSHAVLARDLDPEVEHEVEFVFAEPEQGEEISAFRIGCIFIAGPNAAFLEK